MNYFDLLNTVYYSPGDDAGTTGDADTGQGGDVGADEQETVTQSFKIGNLEVDPTTKEGQQKILEAYGNLQKAHTKSTQELSKIKKTQPKKTETDNKSNTDKIDERFNYIYEKQINQDLKEMKSNAIEDFKSQYPEDIVKKAEGILKKDLDSLDKLDVTKKEHLIKSQNLSFLFNKAIAESMKKSNNTKNDPKKDINNFKPQEDLPPNPGKSDGNNIPGEENPADLYKNDDSFKRAGEMAKKARRLRSGEGVRNQ
jgi:hypothetical protein